MNLNNMPEDKNMLALLEKLGNVEAAYPFPMFVERRDAFLTRVLELQSANLQGGESGGGGDVGGAAAAASKDIMLRSIFAVVLVAEIAVGAFLLRDAWMPLFENATPSPALVVPVVRDTPAPPLFLTETPTELAAPTESMLPVWTPTPTMFSADSMDAATKGDEGKHLGQTPGAPNAPGQDKDKNKTK